jgi:hypothetical protein
MPRLTAIAAFFALAGGAVAAPPALEPLILFGEPYPGMPGDARDFVSGRSRINNSGQWVSTITGNDAAGEYVGVFVVAHDGIRLDPFMTVPFNEHLTIGPTTGLGYNTDINNHGQIAMGVHGPARDSAGNVVGIRSMLVVDDEVVIRSGDTTPFGGQYADSLVLSRFILNDQGHLLSNFDLFANPFSTFDTVIEFSPSESGYDQTVRMTPGMPLQDGFSVRGTYEASWGSYDFSNNGNTIFGVSTTADDQIPRSAIVVNGTILRMSGPTDIFPNGQFSTAGRFVAINDSAEFAYSGLMASSDWEGGRLTVMRNVDEIVWIDDGSDPLLADWTISSLANINVTDTGDVFWQPGIIQNLLGDSVTALFRNDVVIATSDPDFLGDALFIKGGFSFDISDNGQWIIFETSDGIFRTLIPSPGAASLAALCLVTTLRRRRSV